MQNYTEKKKNDWRPFAEKLTSLSKSEGQISFLDRAFEFLNEFIMVDSCAVFKVSADKTSGAEHLCTFGRLEPEISEQLAQNYVKNGFKNDPMVQTALLSSKVRVRHIPDSQYSQAYRSQFFEKANLVDKVSSIHTSRNILFLVSFYRLKGHGKFTRKDFKDLERLAPIIGRFVLRHTRLLHYRNNTPPSYERRMTELIDNETQIFGRLSPREREVCKYSLLGYEEKEIANSMKLSLSTIITHRRRSYNKLEIKSKTDLFQLALKTLI